MSIYTSIQMTFTKLALMTLLWLQQCYAFRAPCIVSRRNMLLLSTCAVIPALKPANTIAQEENKPLTPDEMDEYNRLLEQAKRIQDIIDIHKQQLDDEDSLKNIFFDRIFSELFDEGFGD